MDGIQGGSMDGPNFFRGPRAPPLASSYVFSSEDRALFSPCVCVTCLVRGGHLRARNTQRANTSASPPRGGEQAQHGRCPGAFCPAHRRLRPPVVEGDREASPPLSERTHGLSGVGGLHSPALSAEDRVGVSAFSDVGIDSSFSFLQNE